MPPDAVVHAVADYSNLSLFGLYCATMGSIGIFLRWYIPKIHEDCEKAHKEERQDYLASLASMSLMFEKRMDTADNTNKDLMHKLEMMNLQLHTFSESGVFHPPTSPPSVRRKPLNNE